MTALIEKESGLKKLTWDEAGKILPGDKVFPNIKHMRDYNDRKFGDEFKTHRVVFNDNRSLKVNYDGRKVTNVRWNACYITNELRSELAQRPD